MNFRNQRLRRHLAAYYTIIMSRTLKVTGNHVMYDRGAWFLREIMSSSWALCCSPSVKKQKHDFLFFCVQLLDSVFVISRIIKVSVRAISLTPLPLRHSALFKKRKRFLPLSMGSLHWWGWLQSEPWVVRWSIKRPCKCSWGTWGRVAMGSWPRGR